MNTQLMIIIRRRFTLERIRISNEQIFIYEKAGDHMAKARILISFKRTDFPGNLRYSPIPLARYMYYY